MYMCMHMRVRVWMYVERKHRVMDGCKEQQTIF